MCKNQDEYQKHYEALVKRHEEAKERYIKCTESIQTQNARYKQLGQMIRRLRETGDSVEEFDEGLWGSFVDFITVYKDGNVTITFKDKTKIQVGREG